MNKYTFSCLCVCLIFGLQSCKPQNNSNLKLNSKKNSHKRKEVEEKKLSKTLDNCKEDNNKEILKTLLQVRAKMDRPHITNRSISPQDEIHSICIAEKRGVFYGTILIKKNGEIFYGITRTDFNTWLSKKEDRISVDITNAIWKALKRDDIKIQSLMKPNKDYKELIINPVQSDILGITSFTWNELDKMKNLSKIKDIILKNKLDKWVWDDFLKKSEYPNQSKK